MQQRKRTSKTQRFLETARRQFRLSCIPTATAVLVSVVIGKLGIPALSLPLLGIAGYAYWLGWRIRLVRIPGDGEAEHGAGCGVETQAEGGLD